MSNIQIFTKDNFSVRTIRDEDGKIWFVAKDVAEALEYSEASLNQVNNLFSAVPDIWTAHKRIMASSVNGVEQMREMLCLSEEGLYFFLGRSDKPKALPYQIWIAGDVVPSIRETGNYITRPENNPISRNELDSTAFILEKAGIKDNQLTLALDKLYKTRMGYSALQACGIELIAPEQKQILNPTEIGNELGLSARRVNDILAGAGFQYKIAGNWEPLEDGTPYAVMLDTNKKHSDGTPVRQLKWKSEIIPIIKELI